LNLSATEGWQIVEPVLDNASRHGGALTVNWHDRSIAPERLWGDFYARLVEQMALRGAWFATGCQVVSWFRKRRSANFERTRTDGYRITVGWQAETDEPLPGLRLRCYPPRQVLDFTVTRESRCIDMAFDGTLDFDGRTESPSQTDPSF
jgi:hypothetical protein